ncbi:MAG: DUF2218 domain-containing protein [Maritimibacter sp.]|nr:DUF2218 domain-containing protein [Maritimibacter sp.]
MKLAPSSKREPKSDLPQHRSRTVVQTAKASQHLQQLFKHFAHKRPVEFTAEQGRIEFDFGLCLLDASAHGGPLTFMVQAATEDAHAHAGRHYAPLPAHCFP